MNNLVIPSILVVIVAMAGFIAFTPINNASTVHLTILANTAGLVCVTEEDVILTDANPDNDIVTYTFSQPILLTQVLLNSDATLAGNALDFDLFTVDGALWNDNNSFSPDVTNTVSGNLLSDNGLGDTDMMVNTTLAMTVEAAGTIDQNDIVSITFCGITQDSQNFTSADITSGVAPA